MNYQFTNYYRSLSERDQSIIDDYVNKVETAVLIDKYKITRQRIHFIVKRFIEKTQIDISRKAHQWYCIDRDTKEEFTLSYILKKYNYSIYSNTRKEAVKDKKLFVADKRYDLVYK